MTRQEIWQKTGKILAAALILWLFLRFLGPALLPFLLGYAIAKAAEPAVSALRQRTGLPRWLAAGLCVTVIYAFLSGVLWFLALLLYQQLRGFAAQLPALLDRLAAPAAALRDRLLAAVRRLPDGIGAALALKISSFFRTGAGLPGRIYQRLFGAVSHLVAGLPALALFLVTAILSSFMLAAQLTELHRDWIKKAPDRLQALARSVLGWVKNTLLGWLRAQLRLMSINFLVLTGGLVALGVDYALLLGLGIALLDALPVFGSGAVLLPWALASLLHRQTFRAVGLLLLYGVVTLLRTTLEPRLLGRQLGLSPLLTLLSLYAGFRFFGVPGMILAPMAVMLLKQLWDHGEKQFDNPAPAPDNKPST